MNAAPAGVAGAAGAAGALPLGVLPAGSRAPRPGRTAGSAAGRAYTAGRRLVGEARRRVGVAASPWVVDACLAGGLFALLSAVLRGPMIHHTAVLVPAHLALVVPLAWRRQAPLVVFGCVAGAAFVQWLADVRTPADAALLLALYTVAATRDRGRMLAAFAVLEAGILLATLRWSLHVRPTAMFVSLSAMAVAATVIGANVRGRRERMTFLEDRAVRLERERDQRAQLAVAGERARIAREMHDIVTHNLSVMVALADGAVFAQDASPERAGAAMRQVGVTGRQAITDMRRFLGVLRADEPDALRHPMPGIAQLGALTEQVRAAGLPTRLEIAGEPAAVGGAAQLTVFRLVQEALTNTLKHAPPGARAEVRLSCRPDAVSLTVTDDGAGVVGGDPSGALGHGLPGMRERAAAYGGRLAAGPQPGGGWRVAAELDLTTVEVP
ncbi:histidine kinase [Streptomyces sp. V4-01]|uniref:histidine kinase n=1 Tax=Actinacidiphila polyblastidii TaxID=3110430 RepID=A0ABU7P551_9ACTN|nr:histidine kinase [Streptomyces sp. V4-01]